MTYQRIDVKPIAGALGAEIEGADLGSRLDNTTMDEIHRAFLDYSVIFFRGQKLDPGQQLAFARRFGPIDRHPIAKGMDDHPDVVRVVREPGERFNFGRMWHMDGTFIETPPLGTMLVAQEVPPYGSDTMWASMYLAYDALSDGLKKTLQGMRAFHSSGSPGRFEALYTGMKARTDAVPTEHSHPVVRTHPETGRKCLFLNNSFTTRFEDMTVEESRPLLDYLFRHCVRPEFTCRFRWTEGTLALWDNRCTQHEAISDYFPDRPELFNARRVMHRVTITGDRPV
jgi:taurine dioxygenase